MNKLAGKIDFVFQEICKDVTEAGMDPEVFLGQESSILDYGCGKGEIAYKFAKELPSVSVTGVDVHDAFSSLDLMFDDVGSLLTKNLNFIHLGGQSSKAAIAMDISQVENSRIGSDRYDFCYSWCVFEHIAQDLLEESLEQIYRSLIEGRTFYIKINPLYYSSRPTFRTSPVQLIAIFVAEISQC